MGYSTWLENDEETNRANGKNACMFSPAHVAKIINVVEFKESYRKIKQRQ